MHRRRVVTKGVQAGPKVGRFDLGQHAAVGRVACLCAFLLIPIVAAAQSDAELIEEAVSPLPVQLRDAAAVVTTDANGRQRVIREGTSGFTCSTDGPESGFQVSCINGSTGNVIGAYTSHLARGASIREAWTAVNAAIEAGELTAATPGTLIYIQSGPSRAESALLAVTLVPYATAEATGLPIEPTSERAWLMCPGTPRAHIMFGRQPYVIDENATWERCLLP